MGPILEPWAVAIVITAAFVALSVAGTPIAVSIGATGLLAFVLLGEEVSLVGSLMTNALGGDELIAIPLYILAGTLLAKSGIGQALLEFLVTVMGNVRGGMVGITGGAGVVFGGMSGSGPADTAALSEIFVDPMTKRGYPKPFAAALCAAGGTLGLIIPPSTGYILYALISERASIADLFVAGVVPGLLMAVCLIVAGVISGRKYDTGQGETHGRQRRLVTLARQAPKALIGFGAPLIILGGIYTGTTTVTEAASVAVVYALVVGFVIFRELTMRSLLQAILETGIASGIVLLIVAASSIFSWVVSVTGWARDFSDAITKFASTPTMFVVAAAVIFLVCGLILDGISMYFILVPLLIPGVDAFGINPVYFGIVITMALAIGLITPPMGLDLFAAASVTGVPFEALARWSGVFVIGALGALALVIAFPALSLSMVGN